MLNLGLPAPIDVQVSGSNLEDAYAVAQKIGEQARKLPGVTDVLIPQDIDAPSIQLNINRVRASELGLSQKEVVSNVITTLTSNAMIAPSYWVDPKTGNDYLLTVQYPESTVKSFSDLSSIPLRGPGQIDSTRLDMVADISKILAPTEVDHYQLRRTIDVFIAPKTEDLSAVRSRRAKNCKPSEQARRSAGQGAWNGAGHVRILHQFRLWPSAICSPSLSHPGCTVSFVY